MIDLVLAVTYFALGILVSETLRYLNGRDSLWRRK